MDNTRDIPYGQPGLRLCDNAECVLCVDEVACDAKYALCNTLLGFCVTKGNRELCGKGMAAGSREWWRCVECLEVEIEAGARLPSGCLSLLGVWAVDALGGCLSQEQEW